MNAVVVGLERMTNEKFRCYDPQDLVTEMGSERFQ